MYQQQAAKMIQSNGGDLPSYNPQNGRMSVSSTFQQQEIINQINKTLSLSPSSADKGPPPKKEPNNKCIHCLMNSKTTKADRYKNGFPNHSMVGQLAKDRCPLCHNRLNYFGEGKTTNKIPEKRKSKSEFQNTEPNPSNGGGGEKKGKQKYMVIQMGQSDDENQDQMLIQFLSQNALTIKYHPGAVQF